MKLEEIKKQVNLGHSVFWQNKNYKVIKDNLDQWLILSEYNKHCWGLTWQDNATLNGEEYEFFWVHKDFGKKFKEDKKQNKKERITNVYNRL
jgi:hypothetical protein